MAAYLIVTLCLWAWMFHMGFGWLQKPLGTAHVPRGSASIVLWITLLCAALFAWGSWLLFHSLLP